MLNRRSVLGFTTTSLLTNVFTTRASFARTPGDSRLVVILLRGGLDGLHALIPHGDPQLTKLRPTMTRVLAQKDGIDDLDGYFGLHHALRPLRELYNARELLLIPAASTRYRQRSHFDGQNLLENGTGKPYGAATGWLNRAIDQLHHREQRMGLSIGPTVPLLLQGEAQIQTWADSNLPPVEEDFIRRVARTFQDDALMHGALRDALAATQTDVDMQGMGGRRNNFELASRVAADLLSKQDGPRIAALEMGGWDTHFDQERRLTQLLGQLSAGMLELKRGLGAHWASTAVVVVSEFGRTAAENASRGTDHGTGGLALLAGGRIKGGRIFGDWPGLKPHQLWEGRDLRAVNPYESIFKTLLIEHAGLAADRVNLSVFPDSQRYPPLSDLLRTAVV